VIVSTARGLAERFTPNGDRAIIATRAYDVFTSHTPLDGQYSAASVLLHQVIHSPGPLLYWLLAVPARIGPAALAITMGAANAAAAVAVVLLARRRGGAGLMLATAIALALMCRSLVAETYHDIWNPAAGILPLTALIFLGWSVACGRWRLLPVTVAVASFAAQCQFAFVPPALAVLAVALGALAVAALRRRSEGRLWPWLLGAAGAGAVCWSLPLYDQIVRTGNLGLAVKVASVSKPTLGLAAGWHAVVRAVGIPPWWLRVPNTPFDRLADVRTPPGTLAVVSGVAVLALLGLIAGLGLRRRRGDVASAAVIGLALCAALASVAAFTPTRPSLVTSLGYTMWWGSAAGMWAWLVAGWGVVTLFGPHRLGAGRVGPLAPGGDLWRRLRMPAVAWTAGVAAALGSGTAVAAAGQRDQDQSEYKPIREVIARLAGALRPGDHRIRMAGAHSFTAFDFKAAIIYALRLRGLRPLASNATGRLGDFYESRGRPYDRTASVWDGRRADGGAVVARVSFGAPAPRTITVTLSRRSRSPTVTGGPRASAPAAAPPARLG
jgi:hypothetical protein